MHTAWTASPGFTKNCVFLSIDFTGVGKWDAAVAGYCLDSYKSMDICGINSQVNDQANSGLQWIKGQLAYTMQNNFGIYVVIVFVYH